MTLCRHGILSASSFAWWVQNMQATTTNQTSFILRLSIGLVIVLNRGTPHA